MKSSVDPSPGARLAFCHQSKAEYTAGVMTKNLEFVEHG